MSVTAGNQQHAVRRAELYLGGSGLAGTSRTGRQRFPLAQRLIHGLEGLGRGRLALRLALIAAGFERSRIGFPRKDAAVAQNEHLHRLPASGRARRQHRGLAAGETHAQGGMTGLGVR